MCLRKIDQLEVGNVNAPLTEKTRAARGDLYCGIVLLHKTFPLILDTRRTCGHRNGRRKEKIGWPFE
jgi:hypothetical protein